MSTPDEPPVPPIPTPESVSAGAPPAETPAVAPDPAPALPETPIDATPAAPAAAAPPPPFGLQPSPDAASVGAAPIGATPVGVTPAPGAFVPPPSGPRRNTGLIVGLIVGGVVVVLAIIIAIVLVVVFLVRPGGGGVADPIATDGPVPTAAPAAGGPIAASPDDCVTCYDESVVGDTILPAGVFAAIGLDSADSPWSPGVGSTLDSEFTATLDAFVSAGVTPEECFVVWPVAPITDTPSSPPTGTDPVDYTGVYSDAGEANRLSQNTRLFPTQADAVAHMQLLEEQIDGCPSYGYPDGFTVTVSHADDILVPASVAAVGWSEFSDGDLYYVIDTQRGNLVVRTVMRSDGTISEAAFRDVVTQVAANLGELTPTED